MYNNHIEKDHNLEVLILYMCTTFVLLL